jgi:hypothetical protein
LNYNKIGAIFKELIYNLFGTYFSYYKNNPLIHSLIYSWALLTGRYKRKLNDKEDYNE